MKKQYEKPTLLLSIQTLTDAFKNLIEELSLFYNVKVEGLNISSLEDVSIFVGKELDKEILKTANKLEVIFTYKTGVENFPLDELKRMGIKLCNSHVDSKIIAEYSIGLAFSLLNKITLSDRNLRKGIWKDDDEPYWNSFFDKKVGLLGYGHIGKEIHNFLFNNNMETYVINRHKLYEIDTVSVKDLKELVEKSDIIIASLPCTKDTDKILNKEIFKLMKNKYLINVGRSNCINYSDLYNALKNKDIKGAAIDVWDDEPHDKNDIKLPSIYHFEELDNIILSPHQAVKVKDGIDRYVKDIKNNILNYTKNKQLRNIVDLDKGY